MTTFESATSFLVSLFGEHGATWCTALLVCCEGLCGGAAYVNAFHRLATDSGDDEDDDEELAEEEEIAGLGKSKARKDQEKEFVRLAAPFSAQRVLESSGSLTRRIACATANLVGRLRRHARHHVRVVPVDGARTAVVSNAGCSRTNILQGIVSHMLWIIHHQDSMHCNVQSE